MVLVVLGAVWDTRKGPHEHLLLFFACGGVLWGMPTLRVPANLGRRAPRAYFLEWYPPGETSLYLDEAVSVAN